MKIELDIRINGERVVLTPETQTAFALLATQLAEMIQIANHPVEMINPLPLQLLPEIEILDFVRGEIRKVTEGQS